MRTAKQVLEEHLKLRQEKDLEEDLKRNYAEDVVLLTIHGTFHGHQGVRKSASILREEAPEAVYDYKDLLIEGDVGFLEWTGSAKGSVITDGADSYLVRNGLIITQTIHYVVDSEEFGNKNR